MKQKNIEIHQLLHGYDNGHRLIVASIKPDGQSAKTLLSLSDLSGHGLSPHSEGYLTGYPLHEMGSYAIARTWDAAEMPRPGCVWTHTLLIDFNDLALIDNVDVLNLFERPHKSEDTSAYAEKLSLKIQSERAFRTLPSIELSTIINAIYKFYDECIFIQINEDLRPDDISLAIWFQQWPRLKRNFRFCTWASSDRSRSKEHFDLQFFPYKRKRNVRNGHYLNEKGRWVDIDFYSNRLTENWMELVAKDVNSGDRKSSLRKFLWRYGAETDIGRKAFMPLVKIWYALEYCNNVDLKETISEVENITPPIPSLTFRVIQEVIKFAPASNTSLSTEIEFVVRNISLLSKKEIDEYGTQIGQTLLTHSPDKLWPLFLSNVINERKLAAMAAKKMQPEDALNGANGDPDLFNAIIKANPKLSASPLVWKAPEPFPSNTAAILSDKKNLCVDILTAMMEANNQNIIQTGLDLFGQKAIESAVKYFESNEINKHYIGKRWLKTCKAQPKLLLSYISQNDEYNLETLSFIASLVSHRFPQSEQNKDEWASAANRFKHETSKFSFSFSAFLLARALSGISSEPGVLIRYSFDLVHNYLLSSRSAPESWDMLESELPKVPWWSAWDRARRVRIAVVKTFIERKLSPRDFVSITTDESVFEKLVEIASESYAGNTFLKKVSKWGKKHASKKEYHLIKDAIGDEEY